MYHTRHYVIDFERVKSIDDIIVILKALRLGFDIPSEDLKKLCVLVDKEAGLKINN